MWMCVMCLRLRTLCICGGARVVVPVYCVRSDLKCVWRVDDCINNMERPLWSSEIRNLRHTHYLHSRIHTTHVLQPTHFESLLTHYTHTTTRATQHTHSHTHHTNLQSQATRVHAFDSFSPFAKGCSTAHDCRFCAQNWFPTHWNIKSAPSLNALEQD